MITKINKLLLLFYLILSANKSLYAIQVYIDVDGVKEKLEKGKQYLKNNPDSADFFFSEALKQSQSYGIDSLIGKSYLMKGKLSYEKGDYFICDSLFQLAENYIKKSNWTLGIGILEFEKGKLQIKLGNNDKGVKHYIKAKKIFSQLHDELRVDEVEMAFGIMYMEKGDFEKAKKILTELTKKYKAKDEDPLDLTSTYGFIKYYERDFDSAVYYFNKALHYVTKRNDLDGVAVTYNNIGQALLGAKKYEEARQNFTTSLDIYQSINSKHGEAFARSSLGQSLFYLNRTDEAIYQLTLAFELDCKLGLKTFASHVSKRLSFIYGEKGDYKKAYEYQKLHQAYNDSIINEASDRAIEELRTKYDFDKKEIELQSLKKENEVSALKIKLGEEDKERRKSIFNLLIVIILLIVVASVFIGIGYFNNRKKNKLLQIKNAEIAQQNKEIKDSINYAKKIQEAILPPDAYIQKLYPQSFVFYLPKDIVSGDFYWCEENDEYKYIAAVDCTGHGVPGAFMSIVAHNGLSHAINVNHLKHPSQILDFLSNYFQGMLHQNDKETTIRDGVDIALIAINKLTGEVEYSGANNPLLIYSNNSLKEIPADKQPVGNYAGIKQNPFTLHKLDLNTNDIIYLFSDGFADQFGGEKGKKYKYARFKNYLVSIASLSIEEQKKLLSKEFESWKGKLEQLDDVCVLGIRF